MGERIAKRLARAGIASRRDAEAMIQAGRVCVDGTVLHSPAFNVSGSERIEVDGKLLPAIERTRLFLFHKPAGVVTTNRDPQGRKTVFDILPGDLPRLLSVGRLDMTTEGLLLLTNDGGLSRILELPSTGWLRRYRVRVHGRPDPSRLAELRDGIAVEGIFYGSVEAAVDRVQGSNAWLNVGLREGKNREVRNIMEAMGLTVTRLIRVSYGPFQLGDLQPGDIREIRGRTLRDQLGARLIEEAGANFDAPATNPAISQDTGAGRQPNKRAQATGPVTKRGDKGNRQDRREKALERLQTKAPGQTRQSRKSDQGRDRSSHVWMAPGAKPRGRAKSAVDTDDKTRSSSGEPAAEPGKRSRANSRNRRARGGADRRG